MRETRHDKYEDKTRQERTRQETRPQTGFEGVNLDGCFGKLFFTDLQMKGLSTRQGKTGQGKARQEHGKARARHGTTPEKQQQGRTRTTRRTRLD